MESDFFLASIHQHEGRSKSHGMIIQSMLNLKLIKTKQTRPKELLDLTGNPSILSLHHFDAD